MKNSSSGFSREPSLRLLESGFWLAIAALYALLVASAHTHGTAPQAIAGAIGIRIGLLASTVVLVIGLRSLAPLPGLRVTALHTLAAGAIAAGFAWGLTTLGLAAPATGALEGLALYALVLATLEAYGRLQPEEPLSVQLKLDLVLPAATVAEPLGHFTVRVHGKTRTIATDEVSWIQAAGKYVMLHVGRKVHRVRASMRELEARLDPAHFVRVHRSRIVNLDRVRTIRPWLHGDYRIVMQDGAVVNFSRHYRSRLLHL